MEQPVRHDGPFAAAPASTPDPIPLTSHLLSREYEDVLDWQENQRRSRGKRRGRGSQSLGLLSFLAAAVGFAGTMMRRR